jgi:hypothetical protein
MCKSTIENDRDGNMKYHLKGILACVGLLGLPITPASGEAFARDAIDRYRLGDTGMFTFLAGNVNAFIWANDELRSSGRRELFCVPPSAALGVREVVNILLKHIKETPADEQRPIGSVMLQSLKESFPCK